MLVPLVPLVRRNLNRWRSPDAREGGQVLVLFAGGLVAFCGLVGLSVDVGNLVYSRTNLQKAVDAAALAGAQDLPDTDEAQDIALEYVDLNAPADATAEIQFGQSETTIRVTATREVGFTFLRVLGLNSGTVSATALVSVGTYSGGGGLLPWGFIASNDDNSTLLQNTCYVGEEGGIPEFVQEQDCVIKYGAGSNSGGDFGSLGLDGPGGNRYRNAIENGSDSFFEVGDQVPPETGNMVGPTGQGIERRFDRPTPPGCPGDDRDDVLREDGGVWSIVPGCEESPRIGIIPVVDQIDNPANSTILGFAFIFIKSYDVQGGGNGHAEVTVEFIEFVTELPNSVYEGTGAGPTAIRLVE